jgi:transposase
MRLCMGGDLRRAEMLGPTAETVRKWVRRGEIDDGSRPGLTTDDRARA